MKPAQLVFIAWTVPAIGGCSAGSQAGPGHEPDCVSPFIFNEREYLLDSTKGVERIEPGSEIGQGASESCAQYAGGAATPLGEPQTVYAFPDVPPEQAIVLTNTKGRGFPLIATDEPDGGWDPDLRVWMEGSSVD